MKFRSFYNEVLGCKNEDEVFNYLIENLKSSNTLWSYFVNWDKVFGNIKKLEIGLNLLNYLIGKDDFDAEFKNLLRENPKLIKILPALVVSRNKKFKILVDFNNRNLKYKDFDFTLKTPTEKDLDKYLEFVNNTGLKDLIVSKKIKNLVDYTIGVEAGLDSNGRKNRSGHSMEDIVEVFIKDICDKKGYSYLKEANAKKIKECFDINVPVDKSSRRYDYVVNVNGELVIFEVNFYGGGGSKIKSTAGEYRNLYDVLDNKFKFIWVTDGLGWKTTARPLKETFEHNEYLISLAMLEKGILNAII
ncbi:MAG: type II restriction endonuclease [Candidatus Gastranaerophilales bacterium]|nr:type II restriction endonuclease [Candidatus Gastranaerophilales bacterium]